MRIAERLKAVKPSPSMVVSQAAKAMQRQGIDVIDLGLGEPDFDTPAHIIDAAHKAARDGQTRYTAPDGTMETKLAVMEKFKRENSLTYQPDEITVCNGAKQVIFNALMATVNPGDEVILAAPYFVSYPDMVALLGGVPKPVQCSQETGFKLTPNDLEQVINEDTRWIILNTPCNPSGAVYSETELQQLGEVLDRHPDVLIMSDEIYEHILFDQHKFVSFAGACPQLKDRMLVVNGVSKAYAMTGWRIGYAGGPNPLIKAMATIQSQSTSNPCSISQAAAAAALSGPQDHIEQFVQAFERRRNLVVEKVAKIPGLVLSPPEGAFYAYIGCRAYLGRQTTDGRVLSNDKDIVDYLLNTGRVATVLGEAYGLSPFFRISTATSETDLSEAMLRIENALDQLS